MLIEFLVNETDQSIIDLPSDQRFPLVQGIPLLEEANRELLAIGEKATIDYYIYSDKKQELPTLEAAIELPVTNQTIVEAIQAPVRDDKEIDPDQAQAFLTLFQKNIPKNKRMRTAKPEKMKEKKVQKIATEKDLNSRPFLANGKIKLVSLMACVGLLFFLGGIFFAGQVFQPTQDTPAEATHEGNNLETESSHQDKIDTFSRFFLTNYYMGKKDGKQVKNQIKSFVTEPVLNKVSGTDQQVRSILPWEIQQKGKDWKVYFVVTMQNDQKEIETQLIQFSIKEKKKDHFQVTTIPKEKSFEINQ